MKRAASLAKAILTTDDVWCNAARESCAKEMANWLKQTVNIKRPIDTLKLPELLGLAEHVIAHWIVQASQRAPEEETPSTATLC